MSSPQSAIAPNDEMKPSWGSTQSIAIVSSCFVFLFTRVTRSIAPLPWIALTSQNVRSSILPAATSSRTCATVAAWARKPSRR